MKIKKKIEQTVGSDNYYKLIDFSDNCLLSRIKLKNIQ